MQAALEKKAAALQAEREARRAADAHAAEAEAARQADGRLRRAAERKVRLDTLGCTLQSCALCTWSLVPDFTWIRCD